MLEIYAGLMRLLGSKDLLPGGFGLKYRCTHDIFMVTIEADNILSSVLHIDFIGGIMKKAWIAIILSIVLLLGACGAGLDISANATPTPTVVMPGGGDGKATSGPTGDETPEPTRSRSLYDPSIFVIEASGEWTQELEAGYVINYICELYLHKIDANDNRAVAGSYEGCFWMNMTSDTSEYIDNMFGDLPIDISFDVGGEAVADNLAISLNTTDDKAWVDYSIPGTDGNPLPLTRDTPVGKGSFVAVAKNVYLEAHASGAQGEKVDYSDASSDDLVDVNYVIHVQPDDMESGGSREVVIYIWGDGWSVTLNGTMRRLSGYPEDVSDYLNSSDYTDSAWSHFQE